jgi:hypothetical protein
MTGYNRKMGSILLLISLKKEERKKRKRSGLNQMQENEGFDPPNTNNFAPSSYP